MGVVVGGELLGMSRFRVENIAAVVAAPAAAETPAMIAKVVLDILGRVRRGDANSMGAWTDT